MAAGRSILALGALLAGLSAVPAGQQATGPADDPVKILVGRLDLERYKATIKALTQFGDRRQGTDRNRAAVDWIEAQLNSYGCALVASLTCSRHRRRRLHRGPAVRRIP